MFGQTRNLAWWFVKRQVMSVVGSGLLGVANALNKRLLEKVGTPESNAGAVLRLLQFLPHSF